MLHPRTYYYYYGCFLGTNVWLCALCCALSLSPTVPSQVESPPPVACYQSVPVTESGVYKGSPVFAAERPTSSLLQTEHFSGLLLAL